MTNTRGPSREAAAADVSIATSRTGLPRPVPPCELRWRIPPFGFILTCSVSSWCEPLHVRKKLHLDGSTCLEGLKIARDFLCPPPPKNDRPGSVRCPRSPCPPERPRKQRYRAFGLSLYPLRQDARRRLSKPTVESLEIPLGRSDFLALGGGSARGSYAVRAEGATVTAREPDIAVPRLC